MSLVTYARYRVITGDTTSAATAVTAAIDDAQALLEERLQRELAQGERIERMYPDSNGRLYPHVTPIVTPPTGLLADGDILYSTGPFRTVPDFIFEGNWVDLTYTGGYLERTANPNAANRLPEHVERDLALTAYVLVNRSLPAALIPVGASMARLGDAHIVFGSHGPSTGVEALVEQCWSKATLRLGRAGRRI